ncbi:MAG: GTPase [Polyangiales bacterium]
MRTSAEDRARVLAAIARLEDELSSRDVTAVGSLAARLHALARMVTHERVARVTVVGRRGAGKSSLLNALANEALAKTGAVEDTTGEPRMFEVSIDGTAVQWIDTGGLRAGGAAAHRADMLCEVLANEPPDVLIVAHAASETDAAIDADLVDLRRALDEGRALHQRIPTVIALATRVDELDPPDVFEPPFDDEAKQKHISAAVRALRSALARHQVVAADALAVNTWFSPSNDLRWNMTALRTALLARLPRTISERQQRDELRVLLHRLSDALAAVSVRAFRGDEQHTREWFVATLRRLGPIAARSGDRAELAARPRLVNAPSRWLAASLERTGVRAIADAVAVRALATLGQRVVDAMLDELSTR